jgi:DNA repair exonuclease SbcCD ATPase subunit
LVDLWAEWSGKSALFDAITFALFKEHRGGRDFYPLIHDAAEKAEINLEIILDGQRYLIQRTITRTQRKIKREKRTGAEVWGIVRRLTEGEWQAVAGTTNNIEDG